MPNPIQITLSAEHEKFIDDEIRSGRFASVDEVVTEALARLMLDPSDELDDEDIAAIERSEAQIARGEVHDWAEVSAELRRKYLDK